MLTILPLHHHQTRFLDEVFKSQTVTFVLHSLSYPSDDIHGSHPLKPSLLTPALGSLSLIFLISCILICCLVFISLHRSSIFQTFVIFISSSPFFIPIPSLPPSKPKHISAFHFHPSLWCSHHCWIMSPIKENNASQNASHRLKSKSAPLLQTRCLEAQSRPTHWRVHYGTLLSQLMSLHT